jgi:MFS family permease
MIERIKKSIQGYPPLFWTIVGTLFIDSIGSTLLFPFFALYITEKFGVGMTQAGILIGMSSLSGIIGSTIGGALTDRFGRRKLILFGLVFSAVSSLSFGLANDINLLYFLVILVGLLSRVAAPAQDAMMADILPADKRQEGFGITRVVFNFSWIIGTAVGGLLAETSYFALFVTDAILSSLVALILFFRLPETQPAHHTEAKKNEPLQKTFADYRIVLRDWGYISFTLAGILSLLVYQQQYSSLPVFMRDTHDISPKFYGQMIALTGLEVVLLQIWISRKIRGFNPFLTMTVGVLFFMAGFTLVGLVHELWLFYLAVIVITLGEMITFPTNRVIATSFAPEDMRGRYMAIYDLGWTLPATFGPAAAGLILDNYDPTLIWYIGGAICGVSALWYYVLHRQLGAEPRFQPARDG